MGKEEHRELKQTFFRVLLTYLVLYLIVLLIVGSVVIVRLSRVVVINSGLIHHYHLIVTGTDYYWPSIFVIGNTNRDLLLAISQSIVLVL